MSVTLLETLTVMFQTNKQSLPEHEIHQILANPRRRAAIKHLGSTTGTISVRELSELIAAAETGKSPPPRNVRESVYISLHQTHLPKLQELGLVEYDLDMKEVCLLDSARDIDRYMDVVTLFGISWGGFYRTLGVFGLALVVATLADLPFFNLVDPLLCSSGFLFVFAVATSYQLWTNRCNILRSLRR